MLIEIVKKPDGAGVLRCTRADGSVSWQKQAKHAAHFAVHDLTHYAVESGLGYRQGFFGLVASGWEIEETTGKSGRGPLPAEATEVEAVVGLFDRERAMGRDWTAAEFNQFSPRVCTEADLAKVRSLRASLLARWRAVPAGAALALQFGPAADALQ